MHYTVQVLKTALEGVARALPRACIVNSSNMKQSSSKSTCKFFSVGRWVRKILQVRLLKTAVQSAAPHLRMACGAMATQQVNQNAKLAVCSG